MVSEEPEKHIEVKSYALKICHHAIVKGESSFLFFFLTEI